MKKLGILLAVILLAILVFLGYRLPDGLRCAYTATVDQSVPSELWRYNFVSGKCQYYNGTRWIPLLKVMDVGSGDLSE